MGTLRGFRRRLRRLLRYLVLAPVLEPLGVLPRSWARSLAAGYGYIVFYGSRSLRNRALGRIERSFPDSDPAERWRIARGCMIWVARIGVDFLRLGKPAVDQLLECAQVEGEEELVRAERASVEESRGTIAVTAHFGNWELLGAWFAKRDRPVSVIYEPIREERLDRRVKQLRARAGVRVVPASSAPAMVRALRRGEVLGLLIDRVPRGGGIECRFFDQVCLTAPGAAHLALRTGALVLPTALWEDRNGKIRVRFWPAIDPHELPGGQQPGAPGFEESVAQLTQTLTDRSEEMVRMAPEQWPWFDDRWRRRK